MKRITKILTLLLTSVVLCASVLPIFASAENAVSPRYVNANDCRMYFTTSNGVASAAVTYNAKSDVFSYATITVKIQKRFLGIFWSTVDIGYTDNEWIAYCYDLNGTVYNSFPLEDTGTYRAVFTVEIYGKDGSVDTIEDKITSTYD